MSRCTRCSTSLKQIVFQDTQVQYCARCEGYFLTSEQIHQKLQFDMDVIAESLVVSDTHLQCPQDGYSMNEKAFVVGEGKVLFDQCSYCLGIWFDKGEIKEMSQLFADPKYADEHLVDESKFAFGTRTWWFSLMMSLPMEGNNKVYQYPLGTHTLMIICMLVFAWELAVPEETLDIFALSPKFEGAFPASIVTSMFMHQGLGHLFGNMYFLKIFGDNVEDRLGTGVFVIFYLLAGVMGALGFLLGGSDLPMVGASGAIAGVMAAYMLFFPKTQLYIFPNIFTLFRMIPISTKWFVGGWFVLQIVYSMISDEPIAWFAHIGGFLGGWLLGKLALNLIPDARWAFLHRKGKL